MKVRDWIVKGKLVHSYVEWRDAVFGVEHQANEVVGSLRKSNLREKDEPAAKEVESHYYPALVGSCNFG